MTELNHQGITKALANLRAATTANTTATATATENIYTAPAGQGGQTGAHASVPTAGGGR